MFSRYCSGDLCEVELPVPIPNTEVKRLSGDDSCRATDRENISSPEQCFENTKTAFQLMTHEIPNSLEFQLTQDQTRKIKGLVSTFQEAAQTALIPTHGDCSKPQRPKEVIVHTNVSLEGGVLNINLRASGTCANWKKCYTNCDFNPETGEWELPESKRSIITSGSKVTVTESDLFDRLGSLGKLDVGSDESGDEDDD